MLESISRLLALFDAFARNVMWKNHRSKFVTRERKRERERERERERISLSICVYFDVISCQIALTSDDWPPFLIGKASLPAENAFSTNLF